MSGGRWNYQQYRIGEEADRVAKFLKAVAESERIVDWAESGDDVRHDRSGAERELYDLWLKTFNEV